jgi:PKD repeat protein
MQRRLPLILILLFCISSTWARKVVVTSTGDNISTPINGMLGYDLNNALEEDNVLFDVAMFTVEDIASSPRINSKTSDIEAYKYPVSGSELQEYATLPFSEDFETDWIDLNDTRDVPSQYWKNSPATGNDSWSREDDGIARGAWSYTGSYGYSLPGANGSSHSASYNSWNAFHQGHLDLHVDFSTLTGDKALYFYYLNANGNDRVEISVSENGGDTFSSTVATFRNADTWERKAINLGNLTAENGVIRFSAMPSCCNSRIGIDDITVGAHTTTPIVADFTANHTSGTAPLTVFFSDTSTGDVTQWEWDFNNDGTIDDTKQNPSYTFAEAGTYIVTLNASKPNINDTKTLSIEVTPQEFASLPFHEGFDNEWIDMEATRDVPSIYFRTIPAESRNTWRRNDDRRSISYPISSLNRDYAPTGAVNTENSARFFNEYRSNSTAYLDLFVDFFTQNGDKSLSFWYINSGGNEELEVLLSTDKGSTFSAPLVTKTIEDVWTKVTCSLGDLTASEGVIRFKASSTGGLHMGIDEVKIHVPSSVDVEAHFTGTNLSGQAPLTVEFSDDSNGAPSEWNWDLNGDGNTDATTQNPSFTYTDPGLYNVSLTVSKPGSTSSKTIEKLVFVAGKATLPFHESFDNEWVTRNRNRDVPGIHWLNTPASGDNSWSRIDDGLLRGAWTTDYGTYRPLGANGTNYSAGFNSRDCLNQSGSLDLWVDFSSLPGEKRMEFCYINTSGDDELEVKLSSDGGATFSEPLRIFKTTRQWKKKVINLGELDDSDVVIRFTGHSSNSNSSIGIDEVNIFDPTILPLKADFQTDVTSGSAPLTVQFTDISEGDVLSYEWDFDNDGIVDATTATPSHEYTQPGIYTVSMTAMDINGSNTKKADSLIVVPGYADLPFLESFEAAWVSRDWIQDVPSYYVKNTQLYTGWSSSIDNNYISEAANGTEHSARIPMSFNENCSLDFYIDFSTMEGEKVLTFWSILPNSDRMYVSLSQDGGVTFESDLLILESQNSWTKNTLNLGEIDSPNCVLRFTVYTPGNSGGGSKDSGLDEVGINAIEANFTADVTSGVAPLTVTFQDLSSYDPSSWGWDFDNDGVVDDVDQHPVYTFTEPGEYSVAMRSSRGFSTDRIVKNNYITVTFATDIEDHTHDKLKLYPNPTDGVVYIDKANSTTLIERIEIVDVAGNILQVIESNRFIGQSFDVSQLPEGVVFVRMVFDDKVVMKKLIIRK